MYSVRFPEIGGKQERFLLTKTPSEVYLSS